MSEQLRIPELMRLARYIGTDDIAFKWMVFDLHDINLLPETIEDFLEIFSRCTFLKDILSEMGRADYHFHRDMYTLPDNTFAIRSWLFLRLNNYRKLSNAQLYRLNAIGSTNSFLPESTRIAFGLMPL